MSEDSKDVIVKTIKDYLNDVEITYGSDNKKVIVKKLLDYLLTIPKFLNQHEKFRITVIKKIDELSDQNNKYYYDIDFANKLNQVKIFMNNLENKYYNPNTIIITI